MNERESEVKKSNVGITNGWVEVVEEEEENEIYCSVPS